MLSDRNVVDALERAGIEVEQIISSTEIDKKIVAALIKKVTQHPNADKLHIVEVTTGESDLSIVCGAPNVREGLKVALAQIGAVLPAGDRIEKAKLRGEVSEGMLCSEYELNLGKDHNGILELSSDVAIGTPLCDIYPADTLIDVKTPANRFDVLSVVGLAREVAAMTGEALEPLSPPAVPISAAGPAVGKEAQAARYMLARLSVDQTTLSPRQMATKLQAAGMRTLGPVVDVTNYVMLELGQPLHAFDAAKVKLPIQVRLAAAGESLVTLDGVNRKLTTADLVIADQSGPIGLAGLMGGAATEVGPETKEILLEAAVFDGTTIRKMAKRHGLRTEASARFERGLPVQSPPLALGWAVQLLEAVAGAQLQGATDQLNLEPKPVSIELSIAELSRLLGFGITHKEATQALAKLEIQAQPAVGEKHKTGKSHQDVVVVPEIPWWRSDLKVPEDLVEEVVRVVGYDKVPSTIPSWRPRDLQFDRIRAKRRRVRDLLYGAGLFEVMTYSFVSDRQLMDLGHDLKQFLKLKNPLSSEQGYLRDSLLPSHLVVLARNRTYADGVGFYEISNVFAKRGPGEQPDEPLRLGVTISRPEASFGYAKGLLDALGRELNVGLQVEPATDAVFAPGRYGVVRLADKPVGWIGQLHPDRLRGLKVEGEAAYLELDLTPLMEASTTRQFAGMMRFPKISRDVAVALPAETTWQEVSEALSGLANTAVTFVSDYYGAGLPEGHKSLALHLVLSHPDRTPTEADAVAMEKQTLAILGRKFGAKPRDDRAS